MPTESNVIAVLDMGTNTFKLSVFRLAGKALEEVASDNRVLRIARLIDESGNLPETGTQAIVDAVSQLADIGRSHGARDFIGVATQGFRTARNGDRVLERIARETPWSLRLISGDEEADLTFEGLIERLPEAGNALIVDIGGGSTEVVHARDRRVVASESHRVGSGVLTDRFVRCDPPTDDELQAVKGEARIRIAESAIQTGSPMDVMLLSGGAGQFLDRIARNAGAGSLGPSAIGHLAEVLLKTEAADISAMLDIPLIRAQVIPAGYCIAAVAFERFRPIDVRPAPSGIRSGLARRWVANRSS